MDWHTHQRGAATKRRERRDTAQDEAPGERRRRLLLRRGGDLIGATETVLAETVLADLGTSGTNMLVHVHEYVGARAPLGKHGGVSERCFPGGATRARAPRYPRSPCD